MITVLYGSNTYEADRGLKALLADLATKYPDVEVERLDASEIDATRLPDIFQGTNLFSDHRIIVLRSPSANKTLWSAIEPYLDTVSSDTDMIIVDSAIDKRTKTFKALAAHADMHEYPEFGPRNVVALEAWLAGEGRQRKLDLPRESVRLLVDRVGYDQWALSQAVEKLALLGDGSFERIRDVIVASPSANAFELFEQALRGDQAAVRRTIADLQVTNDPHALVGLLGAQCFQLALVTNSSKTPVELGKLIGSSPYPLQKLMPVVRRLSKAQVRRAVDAITECDRDLKRSVAPPWTLITRALLKISNAA